MTNGGEKVLILLHGEIKTPPMSRQAGLETGFLLRKLQQGELLSMPHSRPMPTIGSHCHESRIVDADLIWRIVYRIITERHENCPINSCRFSARFIGLSAFRGI